MLSVVHLALQVVMIPSKSLPAGIFAVATSGDPSRGGRSVELAATLVSGARTRARVDANLGYSSAVGMCRCRHEAL